MTPKNFSLHSCWVLNQQSTTAPETKCRRADGVPGSGISLKDTYVSLSYGTYVKSFFRLPASA
jgi:hypothetical protein